MEFENTAPKWDAAGAEPSSDLQTNGFTAGYKPPAAYFNFLFHMYTACIKELQSLLNDTDTKLENVKKGAQTLHYYYEPTEIGCTVDSTPTEIWNAMPDHSVFAYPSTSLTNSAWNFPTSLGIVRIEKYAIHRGVIQFFSKSKDTKDYRMFLDSSTGNPSGEWHEYYTSATELRPPFIELMPSADAANGGFVDFHYRGSTEDYTARIIEELEGVLRAYAPNGFSVSHNLNVGNEIKIPDKSYTDQGTRIYSSDGIGMSYMTDPLDMNSARSGMKINVPTGDIKALARVFRATEAGDAQWYNLYGEHNKPTAADASATPWTVSYADTFETFWNDIYTAADGMGAVAFRLKDTGGWGAAGTANSWYNGVAFWQNPPTGTDNVSGTIITRLNSDTNLALYKGVVTGNATDGYTLNWHKVYDTGNKPTVTEVGALAASDVVNNLTSTATAKPLSAYQGKVLNDKVTEAHTVTKVGSMNANKKTLTCDMSSLDDGIYIITYTRWQEGKGMCGIVQKHTINGQGTFVNILSNQKCSDETTDFLSIADSVVTVTTTLAINAIVYIKKL